MNGFPNKYVWIFTALLIRSISEGTTDNWAEVRQNQKITDILSRPYVLRRSIPLRRCLARPHIPGDCGGAGERIVTARSMIGIINTEPLKSSILRDGTWGNLTRTLVNS